MMNNVWLKRKESGFTIIELIVVIVVIAILSTLTVVVYNNYQKQARDTERQSAMESLADALENYYNKNGEYPGCAQLTGSAASVAQLLHIDQSALVSPNAPAGTTNSLRCGTISYSSPGDPYGYKGDGSATCTTGASCLSWTLQYRDEQTQQIVTISSKHTTNYQTSGQLALTASNITNVSAILTWNAIPNTINYTFLQSTNADMSSATSTPYTAATSATISGLSPGQRYYFQVVANSGVGTQVASSIVPVTTTLTAPAGSLAVNASSTGSGVQGVASGLTCGPGTTLTYSMQYNSTNSSTPGGWSPWATGGTYSIATAYRGSKYTFQARAQCTTSVTGSSYSNTVQVSVVAPFQAIAAPTWAGPANFVSSGNDDSPEGTARIVTYIAYCPANTSTTNTTFTSRSFWFPGVGYSYFGPHPWGFADYWNRGAYPAPQWIQYTGTYTCQTAYASINSPATVTNIPIY